MNRMRILNLVLAVLLILTAAPCAFAQAEQIELKVGYNAPNYMVNEKGEDKLAQVYADFEKQYPNIKIKLEYIANSDWADYTTKVQTMFAAGTAPDLIYSPAETENAFVDMGMVIPLTEFLTANPSWQQDYEANVAESLRKVAIHNGEYYGFVHLWENDVLWLNNEVFRAAGATIPKTSWTWEEFEAACDLIEKNTDAYAFGIPGSYYVNCGWLFSYGTGYLNDDYSAITFDSPQSQELVQFYKDAVDKGWATADWNKLDDAGEFVNGRLAMVGGGRWPMSWMKNENFTDVTAVYIPVKYSDRQTCAWASMQVCSGTKNYEAAALLAAWTGSYEFCSRFSRELNTNIPARADVNTPDNYLFSFDGQELFYEAYENTVGLQNPPYFADLETIWKACITSVISGEKDVPTAVNDAAIEMRATAGL